MIGSLVNDDTIPNNSVNNDNSQDASSPDHQAENHHNDAKISSGNGSNSETETATEETSNGPIKVSRSTNDTVFEKSTKKSHSTLRAKRPTFTF